MKASLVLLAAAAGLTSAAQVMTDVLPECSHECLKKGISSGSNCKLEDSECLCEVNNYRNIYSAAEACALQACGAAKSIEEVLPAAAQFCFEVTDGATAPAVDDSASATASRASGTASSDATGTPAPSQSGSSDESTTTASPDGAAAMGSIGGVGMMILGLLAAF